VNEYSAFRDTLSVTPAQVIEAAIRSLDYELAIIESSKPGRPTLLTAVFMSARLDMLQALLERRRDHAALDAYLDQEDRDRIDYELDYRKVAPEFVRAQLNETEEQP
jgi:hypothetical protein